MLNYTRNEWKRRLPFPVFICIGKRCENTGNSFGISRSPQCKAKTTLETGGEDDKTTLETSGED